MDAALVELVLAVDALGVDPQQDSDAVPCPLGDLRRGNARAESGGHAGVAEVVHPPGERGAVLGLGEGVETSEVPHSPVGGR